MSDVLLLQHDPLFPPGRIVPVFRDYGIPLRVVRLFDGDAVPDDLDEVRVLVSLGGTMRHDDGDYPFLAAEVEAMKQLVEADRPVLGIGLGAQLLARAAGAKVYPLAKAQKPGPTDTSSGTEATPPPELTPEFGWRPARFPFPGGTEPLVMGLMDGAPMVSWHRDTFDLPALPKPDPVPPGPPPPTGNALMSSTPTTKNAAFRFKTSLIGFQYHFEQTRENLAALGQAGVRSGAMTADEGRRFDAETEANFQRHERLGNRLLRNYVQYMKAY